MPKFSALKNENPIDGRFAPLVQALKGMSDTDEILLCEQNGNGEASITILEGQYFVEAPNNKKEGLTLLTSLPSQAIHGAKEIIEAYYS